MGLWHQSEVTQACGAEGQACSDGPGGSVVPGMSQVFQAMGWARSSSLIQNLKEKKFFAINFEVFGENPVYT